MRRAAASLVLCAALVGCALEFLPPKAGPDSGTDTDTDADTDADTDVDSDTDTDTDSDADTDMDTDVDTDADTDTDSGSDVDTDADSDTDSDPDTDSESVTSAEECPFYCMVPAECLLADGTVQEGYTCPSPDAICCELGAEACPFECVSSSYCFEYGGTEHVWYECGSTGDVCCELEPDTDTDTLECSVPECDSTALWCNCQWDCNDGHEYEVECDLGDSNCLCLIDSWEESPCNPEGTIIPEVCSSDNCCGFPL